MTDYYEHERFIKAFYSNEKIVHEGESVKILSCSTLDSGQSIFHLSNGIKVSLKSNLKPFEDINFNLEKPESNSKKDKGLEDRLSKYEISLQIMIDLIMTMILFIEKNKDKFDQDALCDIKKYIDSVFNALKGDIVV